MRMKFSYPILLITMLLCMVFVPGAYAVGVSPIQGIVGTEVFISDLGSGVAYVVKWDTVSIKSGVVPLTGIVSFFVGEATGGEHTLVVESPSGTQVFSGNFTVLPSISIDPTTGIVGDTITVTGKGFAASESQVKVMLDSVTVKSGLKANSSGSWETTFVLPATTSGNHAIDASGTSTDAVDIADKTFAVESDLIIDPDAGGVGTTVTVSGTAFDASEPGINVTYDGTQVKTGIVADTKGSWKTSFSIPVSAKGDHVIDAAGSNTSASEVPDVSFSVSPGVTILPDSVYVGEEIVINGSGFAASESDIKILMDIVAIESDLTANSSGQWSASYTVPEVINGSHLITASGDITPVADVTGAILKVMAKISLKPLTGSVGDSINVDGTGFGKNKAVTVKYGSKEIVLSISTNSSGSFNANIPAQEGMSGNIIITATDADEVAASANFSMEANAPEAPRIASPKDGARVGYLGDTKVKFDWTDVSDPSGVFYNLQLNTTTDFSTPVLDISKLTESEYMLLESESLPPGKYYWRIQAVDRAGNNSKWVGPLVIRTAFVSITTFAIIIVAVIAFIIIVSTVPRAIVKAVKKRNQ